MAQCKTAECFPSLPLLYFMPLLHLTCYKVCCCSFKKPVDSEATHKEEERRNLASALFGGIRASSKVLSQSFLCDFVGYVSVIHKLCCMYKKIIYHVKTMAMLKCSMRNGKL